MALLSRLTTWNSGDTLTASALNAEFNNFLNDYNGNITNANIASNAAIALSKLASTPATLTGVETFTNKTLTTPTINGGVIGSAMTGMVFPLDRSVATVTVNNTAVETSVYSYSVLGNTLGTNKALRLTILGSYLNNSGASRDLVIRVKYGATTIATKAGIQTGAEATIYDYMLQIIVAANGTGSQKGVFSINGRALSNVITIAGYGTASEDSTSDKTLSVTIQHGAADSNLTFTKEVAMLELINFN